MNGDGKPDDQRVLRNNPASVYYDLEFRFEIVGNQGKVETGDR
jgi:hypothetical protein